jgi:alkylglycerol monooxygenase
MGVIHMGDYNINGLAIPLFLIFMLLEYLFLKIQGRSLHRYNDSVTSLSMGILLLLSDAILKAYTFMVFIYLWENFRLFDFATSEVTTWITFFFLVDFCYYWFHRTAHEVNFLWGAHVGHHQSEEYNLTASLRQSAFQYAFSWVFYLPLALLGCPPIAFLILFIALKIYQFWLHTQAIGRIPLIEGILSTPSSHRVHHAKNPIYIDRNYGGTLVIWDRIFNSWQPELANQTCHYGTTHPLRTLNPIHGNLQHWSILVKDTIKTKRWSDKIQLWFKPTGWRPEDCQNKELNQSLLQKTGCEKREKYDPQVSLLVKIYVGFCLLSIIALTVMFTFLAPVLSASQLTIGAVLILFGLVVTTDFLEGNKKYVLIEIIRLPALAWFLSTLWLTTSTTHISNTIIMDKPPSEVLTYASTPALWQEWHPQSSKIKVESQGPLQTGDKFEEDVLTAIGKNHLSWEILSSTPGAIWVAKADNQENGVSLVLTYKVENINGNTRFIRELDYTMPNFLFLVANEVFFRRDIKNKSESALQRLKTVIESKNSHLTTSR